MMLSLTAEYALRAVLYLAQQDDERLVRVEDVAVALKIPRNYLSKILHVLGRSGTLASTRGKTGGFQLAIAPDRLTLLDIVREFDDMGERRQCLLGRPTCSDSNPCPAHHRWKATADKVAQFFRDTTVADLIEEPSGSPVRA